ncbi:carbonic anhydrase family protein [Wenzhouxiangella marina]|uniref:Carbonic anhydrase n=1 Tax=Wenzhouxiangella marina TaxID=1579979 RepID=A0A0K0XU37_9GAMM|nr:carbonic anhydrase family protein [Wenzhouxiangella marina]AKS41204.1 Carbonic anhydrase [Wenzhouxiangella marina]MBB6088083.1 carbonic anhydrase [Wenzhouxiangella marina]
MKNRLAGLMAVAVLAVAPFAVADDDYRTFDQASQSALTPDEALQLLIDGNARFVAGESIERDLIEQQRETAGGQYPFAVVLSCLDSRSAPEVVFDQGVGDIFVGRVAGNVVDTNLLGSFEFATAAAGSKLIVVMGHTACGAVMGACDGVEVGNLTALLDEIEPAIDAVSTPVGTDRSSANAEFVNRVAETNVRMQVNELLRRSDVIRGLVEQGQVKVVGAIHDLATGEVRFL